MSRYDIYIKEEFFGKQLTFRGNTFPWEAIEAADQILSGKYNSSPRTYLNVHKGRAKATEQEIWWAIEWLIAQEGQEFRKDLAASTPLQRRMMVLEGSLEISKQLERYAVQVSKIFPESATAQDSLEFARAHRRMIQRQITEEIPV